MRLLLDTHVLLWWMNGDKRLPQRVAERLIDSDNEVYISAVSVMEMATKASIGKLRLPAPVSEVYEELRGRLRAAPMPVTVEHGAKLADLPLHHRDPFDRLLVAQAQIESLSLVSADPEIATYSVDVIW